MFEVDRLFASQNVAEARRNGRGVVASGEDEIDMLLPQRLGNWIDHVAGQIDIQNGEIDSTLRHYKKRFFHAGDRSHDHATGAFQCTSQIIGDHIVVFNDKNALALKLIQR